MKNQIAFIFYDSRSGSTLLAALLNRYKGVSVSLESAYVSRVIEYGKVISASRVDELIEYLLEEIQFRELGLDLQELRERLCAHPQLTKAGVISAITNLYFGEKAKDATCWIIKHPPFGYLPEVVAMFPDVKFIQIVRDGRAVFSSKKNTNTFNGKRMETHILKAAWDWKLKIRKLRAYSDRLVTIRYEDLIADHSDTCLQVLSFLDVPSSGREITKSQSEYHRGIGANQKSIHENVARKPQSSIVDKWKRVLSRKEIALYSFVNSSYLKEYGYEVGQDGVQDVFLYYCCKVVELLLTRSVNVFFLLGEPRELFLKVRRNYSMLKGS